MTALPPPRPCNPHAPDAARHGAGSVGHAQYQPEQGGVARIRHGYRAHPGRQLSVDAACDQPTNEGKQECCSEVKKRHGVSKFPRHTAAHDEMSRKGKNKDSEVRPPKPTIKKTSCFSCPTVNIRPSAFDCQHSTVSVRPSTFDRPHSTVNIRPSTFDRLHSTVNIRPSIFDRRLAPHTPHPANK